MTKPATTKERTYYVHRTDGSESGQEPVVDPSRRFFVSLRNAGRFGLLLGPYDLHIEALGQVERGRELAIGSDPFAHFYEFGTCSLPRELSFSTVFGA